MHSSKCRKQISNLTFGKQPEYEAQPSTKFDAKLHYLLDYRDKLQKPAVVAYNTYNTRNNAWLQAQKQLLSEMICEKQTQMLRSRSRECL